ncbi:hypothetical protein FLAN108750_01260 [Flavobacterium antarcticum]
MIKSFTTEIFYIISSFIVLLLFSFFYGIAFPLEQLAFKLSYSKMSGIESILYFWIILMFLITLFRQITLKFRSYFSNLIIIILGIILLILFNNFIQNTSFQKLTVKEGLMIYEKKTLTTSYISFRILQLLILILVFFSSYKMFKKSKVEN